MISESTWLAAADPKALLAQDDITLRYTGRKLRLLALALARQVRDLVRDEEVRSGFELAEYVADLPDDHEEEEPVADLLALRRFKTAGWRPHEQAAMAFCEAIGPPDADADAYDYLDPSFVHHSLWKAAKLVAAAAAAAAAGPVPPRGPAPPEWHRAYHRALADMNARLIGLTRCVLGNPFRPPPAFDPAWRTSVVVSLARTMYETRAFAGMPILADALEEAGCDDAEMLAHCRHGDPHARGCWLVDAVLGKG